jgi:TonB-dependent starch-binding outer membrane protein SusC
MSTRLCSLCFASTVLALVLIYSPDIAAQGRVTLSGTLTNSLTGATIPNAVVQIDELRQTATSNADGMFTFANVPPGTYHLSVHTEGYSTRRTEVTVATAAKEGLGADNRDR